MSGYTQIIAFDKLNFTDLFVDALYKGGPFKNVKDDPISKLMGCSNQSGFRYIGSMSNYIKTPEHARAKLDIGIKLCVLYSDLNNPDWPDRLDKETGLFTYYGDNRKPGNQLLDTDKKGNLLLQYCFDKLHVGERSKIPPFFIFNKAPVGRDVFFAGLAVPGSPRMTFTDDLVAIWKTTDGRRFQNYKATFTILNVPHISRLWLEDIKNGNPYSTHAPPEWIKWIKYNTYIPLQSTKTVEHRTKKQQLPSNSNHKLIVQRIIDFFKIHPEKEYAFEKCAAKIAQLMDDRIIEYETTRPWKDGGRDAIGQYRIGTEDNGIYVEFALEAKCKNFNCGSGIKDTSRLISRLRHRQFGVFVTTSYVSDQAYKEIKEDQHPVVIISGEDIAKILITAGYKNERSVSTWLEDNFK